MKNVWFSVIFGIWHWRPVFLRHTHRVMIPIIVRSHYWISNLPFCLQILASGWLRSFAFRRIISRWFSSFYVFRRFRKRLSAWGLRSSRSLFGFALPSRFLFKSSQWASHFAWLVKFYLVSRVGRPTALSGDCARMTRIRHILTQPSNGVSSLALLQFSHLRLSPLIYKHYVFL